MSSLDAIKYGEDLFAVTEVVEALIQVCLRQDRMQPNHEVNKIALGKAKELNAFIDEKIAEAKESGYAFLASDLEKYKVVLS